MKVASAALIVALAMCAGTRGANAQTPVSGTSIGNQASASYTDGSGTPRTATSNSVTTTVTQLAAVDLQDPQTVRGAVGQPVFFPHTVVNTGNGNDSYNLTAVEATDPNNALLAYPGQPGLAIYPDLNQDGRPDAGSSPITVSPILAPGASFNFVVAGLVNAGAASGNTATTTVTAASVFTNTITDTNTDTLLVSANAIIDVRKQVSAPQGAPGSTGYTYTLTYTNNGTDSGRLILTDTLPAGLTYRAGSGRWAVGNLTLTDATGDTQGTAPDTIDYSVTGNTVTASISRVPAGASFFVSFGFDVATGATPGVKNNTATFQYDDDNNGVTPTIPGTTNTVPFTVTATGGVTGTGDPQAGNPPAPQGGIVNFDNSFTNTGSGPDTFDITVAQPGTFPTGTTFNLFRSDGATPPNLSPLVDTNNNGIPDTGTLNPIAPGNTILVVLQATLPPSAAGNNGGAGFNVTKTATSPTTGATITVTDGIPSITASTVDLQNVADAVTGANAGGAGAGPEAAAVNNYTVAPGATVRVALSVTNGSTLPANYNLFYSSAVAPALPTFTAANAGNALPTGYTLRFVNAGGSAITNTGNVPASGTVNYFAEITAPANALPGVRNIYFRVVQANGGAGAAQDTKFDTITVGTTRRITIDPNNTGQTFQGSSIVYNHSITNSGNVPETVTLTSTNNQAGFTTVNYIDVNNNGVIDAGDTQIPDGGTVTVNPGTPVNILTKVFTPSGAAAGTVNVTTLTITPTGGAVNGTPIPPVDTATDTTTIVAGQLRLLKEQALDANNDGTPDTGFGTAIIAAAPGQGIRYRITVTNIGTTPVTDVVVNDATPGFTTYNAAGAAVSATGAASFEFPTGTFTAAQVAPADNGTGSFRFALPAATPLQPGSSVVVYFGVTVNGP